MKPNILKMQSTFVILHFKCKEIGVKSRRVIARVLALADNKDSLFYQLIVEHTLRSTDIQDQNRDSRKNVYFYITIGEEGALIVMN